MKSTAIAYLLLIFAGVLGAHAFYLDNPSRGGIILILTFSIWWSGVVYTLTLSPMVLLVGCILLSARCVLLIIDAFTIGREVDDYNYG